MAQRDTEENARPGALERRRLRRRLDRQERMREALLLDLGALVFELHRQSRREPELLQAKASELHAVDEELRGLADAVEEGHGLPALTARGLVAGCTACNGLMGSRDRFCPSCGAAAGAAPDPDAGGRRSDPMKPPDFGETEEFNAFAMEDEPDDDVSEVHNEPAPQPDRAVAVAEPPATDPLVPRAQRRLRAGRRMARQWLEQRRSNGR